MGYTLDAAGKPVIAPTPTQTVVDMQAIADYAAGFALQYAGTSAQRTSLAPGKLRDGLLWTETDTFRVFQYFTTPGTWRLVNGSRLLGQWHKNVPGASAGGQPLGPSSNSYAIAAVPYARAIRVTGMGGVLPSANGNGGVLIVPSTGAWAGGTNEHRVNASPGSFNDLSYVWYMANLPANTALTLTMTSQSSVTAGYDLHFTVEEF